MTNLNKLLLDYVQNGGTMPATFMRGYADRGRFGVRGEGAGVPEAERDDYEMGGQAAQADREAMASPTEE